MAKPCGCGGKRAPIPEGSTLRVGYTPTVGPNGVYSLLNYPDCQDGYTGPSRYSDVFVVGIGTPGERMFRRSENHEAVAYARQTKLRLGRFNAHTLCTAAMVDLFGS